MKGERQRTAREMAVPKWVGKEDIKLLSDIHKEKRKRNRFSSDKWTVDHIIPLNSPLVCGLHWYKNMQLMVELDNNQKGNIVWPGMPEYTLKDLNQLYKLSRKVGMRIYKREFKKYSQISVRKIRFTYEQHNYKCPSTYDFFKEKEIA